MTFPIRCAGTRQALAAALAVALAMVASPAAASFVHTYTSKLNFVFEFETAGALAAGVETRLVATADFATPVPNILSWSFNYGSTTFGSDSVGEVLTPLYVLTSLTGGLHRICGGGSLAGVGSFFLNNANTPGDMLSGTNCASQVDNYEELITAARVSGMGLGTWSMREVTAPPPPPPPGNAVPEPGSLLLAAAALLALSAARRGMDTRR